MWGFLNIKDNVQNATGLLRNISDRMGGQYDSEKLSPNEHGVHSRNAMENVVTPSSIPQFTLPPTFIYESAAPNRMDSSLRASMDPLPQSDSGMGFRKNGHDIEQLDRGNFHKNRDTLHVKSNSGESIHSKSGSTLSIKSLVRGASMRRSENHSDGGSSKREKSLSRGKRSRSGSKDSSIERIISDLNRMGSSDSTSSRRSESLWVPDRDSRREQTPRKLVKNPSNSSSTFSTPQGSPAAVPRFLENHKNYRDGKQTKENHKHNNDRLYVDDDTEFCSSDSENRQNEVSAVTRLTSRSFQNIRNEIDGTSLDKTTPQPCVRICLTYLVQHKRLNVSILEGKHFPEGHLLYLKVTLLPRHERSHRTEPLRVETNNLNIRERLTFDSVREEDIPHMSLKICCKEKHSRIRHADVVGECILALCDIDFTISNDFWMNLRPFEEEEVPHIQLSLCYDAMLGCLNLDVVAARNVPKGSLGRPPDCFVTLTEISSNGKITKKQTKVVHRTQDPVFQESFLFSMCTDAQTPDELVIIATLFAKDRVKGSTESLGEAKLGQLVDNWSGRSQWAQALANEGEPVMIWHTLVMPDE